MRQLWSIQGNSQRLDGGAMFGNAPKALWSRWIEADARNRIPLACRAMLVQDAGRWLLFETGIGAFFEPKMRERFGVVESEHVLLESLRAVGLEPSDIDVVVLSHLHFDHAGGLLTAYDPDAPPALLFEGATYVVGSDALKRARAPHPRDKASFIPALLPLLDASGRLEVVEGETCAALGPEYRFHHSDGHTPGLVLVEIPSAEGPIVFGGDLVPGVPWVHAPITMGYDRYPELLIDEKTALLGDLQRRNGRLFFTHDPVTALARLDIDDRGRFAVRDAQETVVGLKL